MPEIIISLASQGLGKHMKYAAWFADDSIEAVSVRDQQLVVAFKAGERQANIAAKLDRLMARFANMESFQSRELFRTEGSPEVHDVYPELIERRWVVELGRGQVTLRGLALDLFEFLDDAFVRHIGGPAHARREYYPGVMATHRLDRTNHFSSFPEHVHFVSHLREDLDVLDRFAAELRAAGGWQPALLEKLERPLAEPALAINPATCYHCYASVENQQLEGEGFVATARSRCHRYESGNHQTLARLLDFTMREVIFVGKPDFVKREREAAIQRVRGLVAEWGLASWMETANDPFFTNDFEVKAAFQRQNDMKYELCMPLASGSVAVASSNFHSVTFGKAFNILVGTRPACTGCAAFGLERWVYAVLSQVGCAVEKWPAGLRTAFLKWHSSHG